MCLMDLILDNDPDAVPNLEGNGGICKGWTAVPPSEGGGKGVNPLLDV